MLRTILFKFIIVLLIFVFANGISAQSFEQKALMVASNYISKSFSKEVNKSKISGSLFAISNNSDTLAYIVNILPQGYIIVSANEDITPILGFSTENNFDTNISNDNVLLNMVKEDLVNRNQIIDNVVNASSVDKNDTISFRILEDIRSNNLKWHLLQTSISKISTYDVQYGPLLKSVWGGVNCFNYKSEIINVGNYYTPNHYSPGCVATSTSIVMNYFEWPPTGMGYHTDYDNTGSSTGAYYANFGATKYEWWRMLDKYYYTVSQEKHHKAMGRLAYDCAVAVDMNFEFDGSSSNVNRVPAALRNYFRYTSHYKASNWFSFWPRMRENIRNGLTVEVAISKTNGEGHAMVCDGYGQDAGQARFYHLNFGWWGNWNGWYDIQGSWDASGYTIIDGAVFDIIPIPLFGDPIYSEVNTDFVLPIKVAKHLSWDSFKIWESYNGGSYNLIESSFDSLNLHRSVTKSGLYRYKIQAKVNGAYYSNSVSEPQEVLVERSDSALVSLKFDGNDSYFIKDNYVSDLDVKKEWTIETWVNIKSLNTNSDWDVILDRQGVFSLYLIDDNEGDYAVRFVSRDNSGAITASLRSDSSEINLKFNEWVHIAISYDSTNARLFVNGILVQSSNDKDFRLNYSTKALNLGGRYWGSYSRYLVGELDEVRLSDTARYNSDFVPYRCMPFITDDYTRLLLHLDENSGDAIGDVSRHFFNINLRSSPNSPNWNFNKQKPVLIFNEGISAKLINDSAIITWSSNYEAENISYELQKTTNYSTLSEITDWSTIAIIDGVGDTLNTTYYSFTDIMPPLGRNYYQLLIINSGCKYFYSSVDSVNVLASEDISIYPIPASKYLKVHGMRGNKIDNIRIYDINGRDMEPLWRIKQSSEVVKEIDIRGLSVGMYIMRVEMNAKVSFIKFIVGG